MARREVIRFDSMFGKMTVSISDDSWDGDEQLEFHFQQIPGFKLSLSLERTNCCGYRIISGFQDHWEDAIGDLPFGLWREMTKKEKETVYEIKKILGLKENVDNDDVARTLVERALENVFSNVEAWGEKFGLLGLVTVKELPNYASMQKALRAGRWKCSHKSVKNPNTGNHMSMWTYGKESA